MKIAPASAARFSRTSVYAAAMGTLLTLAGCGGGGSSSSTDDTVANSFPSAYVVIGQKDFSSVGVNQNGSPSANTLAQPAGAAGSNGTLLYVPDQNNNRVLGFNTLPTVNNTTANFVVGQADFTSTGAATSASALKLPGRAWVSSGNKLVVTDTNNNRVLIWNSLPSTNTPADVVVGQADFASGKANAGSSTPSASTLNGPTAAVIANGELIVADRGNNRVLVWATVPTSNGVAADYVLGQPDMTSNTPNNPCTLANPQCSNIGSPVTSQYNLSQPNDVWSNDSGRLLIADTGNNRVIFFSQVPTSNFAAATSVLGKNSFTSSSNSTSSTGMYAPTGVGSDGTRIYVADSSNNRVLVYSGFPTSPTGTAATTVIGQKNFTNNAPNDDNQTNSTTASNSNVVSARTLKTPTAVNILGGNLFVTDSGNNRVLGFKQ